MELQVINHVQEFKWNFEEIKTSLASHIKKFTGLVVTEENLPDMEAAQKEIASIRVKLDGFRKEVKKRMNEPYKKFENEVKELQALIETAEAPLKNQIQKYEDARIAKRTDEIMAYAKKAAAQEGLRAENLTQFVVLPEWTRRTAKDSTVYKAVRQNIVLLMEHQRNADEAASLRKQKTDLIAHMCELYSRVLKTPIVPEDVAHLTHDAELAQIPEIIMVECNKRLEVEQRAGVMSLPQTKPPLQAGPPVQQDIYEVELRLPNITLAQADEVIAFFASRNITYQVLRQTKIGGALSDVS